MSLAIDFEAVLTQSQPGFSFPGADLNTLSDGKLLASLHGADSSGSTKHFLSEDDGASWTLQSTETPSSAPFTARTAHLHENKLFTIFGGIDTYKLRIYESTDDGATWSLVKTIDNAGATNPVPPNILDWAGFNRGELVLVGRFGPISDVEYFTGLKSSNNGEDWDDDLDIVDTTYHPNCSAIGVAGGGKWIAGAELPIDDPRTGSTQPWFARSTNYGASWTRPVNAPAPGPMYSGAVNAICTLDQTIVLAGGQGIAYDGSKYLYLWRSTNAGASWSAIPQGDVTDIDDDPDYPYIAAITRMPGKFALLGFRFGANVPSVPWRISTDHGETWSTTGLTVTGSIPSGSTVCSNFALSRDGHVLVTTTNALASSQSYKIWRGTVTC